jgi:hypothetical protein
MYDVAEHIVALAQRTDWFFLAVLAVQESQDAAAGGFLY